MSSGIEVAYNKDLLEKSVKLRRSLICEGYIFEEKRGEAGFLERFEFNLEEYKQINKPFYTFPNFITRTQKTSKAVLPLNTIMESIKKLESMLEDNTKKLEEMRIYIESFSTKSNLVESEKKTYVCFKTREDVIRAINYCQEHRIDTIPVAPGTLRIPSCSIDNLKSSDIKFKEIKDIRIIYEDKEFLEKHKRQIKEYYGIK